MPRRALPKLKPGQYKWIERGLFARGTHKGNVFGISYTINGRRRIEIAGPTLTLARRALTARRGEIVQGRFRLKTHRSLPTLREFAKRYLKDYSTPNKRSWKRDEWVIRTTLGSLGALRIDQIRPDDLERFRARRVREGVTLATANRDVALVKHMLSMAVTWGLLETSPTVRITRTPEKPFRVLSKPEERALLEAAAPHLRPIIVLALYTGLRRGELLGLEWRDINLQARLLTVRQSKSGRVRTVDFGATAAAALAELPLREGRVFRFQDREIMTNVRQSFLRAIREAGIRPLRFHDLRHTYVSRLVARGVALPVIQQLAGHASILTTMRYAHVDARAKREAALCLDDTAT